MGTRLLVAVVGACLVVAGCSGSSGPLVPTATTPAASTTASPSTSAGAPVAVQLRKGSATVRVSGGVKEKLTLSLGPSASWQAAPGTLDLSYLTRSAEALLIQGSTPTGSTPTSSELTLSLVLQRHGAQAFSSTRGECRITITRSRPRSFSGRFACAKLRGRGKTIRATGTFQGSA